MLPAYVAELFWDVDPGSIDLTAREDYVLARVMARGTSHAMRWLREQYSEAQLAAYLRRKGDALSPRDRAYWRLVAGLPPDDAPGGGRPPWASGTPFRARRLGTDT
jgi:hypothetical protein